MDKIDISFVVPVYNTPKYLLEVCCESLEQNIKNINYEVLIIDDGSNRYVREFFDAYKKNEVIKYFAKKNGGVSDARNYGIERSKGEYICFVDPDDQIEFAWNKDKRFNLSHDIYFFNYSKIDSNNQPLYRNNMDKRFENKSILTSSKLFEGLLRVSEDYSELDGFYLGTPWGKLFKRDFIMKNKLNFDVILKKRQDALFCAQAYLSSNQLSLLTETAVESAEYFYLVENQQSITKKYNQQIKNIYLYLFASMERLNDIYQLQLNEALSLYSYDLLKELINLDFCNVQNNKSYKQRKHEFLSFRENKVLERGFKKIPYQCISFSKKGLYFFEKYSFFFGINFIYIFRKLHTFLRHSNK